MGRSGSVRSITDADLPQHAIIQRGSISLDRTISEIDVVSGTATGRTRKSGSAAISPANDDHIEVKGI